VKATKKPRKTHKTKPLKAKGPRYLFRLAVEYPGVDHELDDRIRKVVGRDSVGSGFGFIEQIRDIDFLFVRKSAALNAAKRVRGIKRKGLKAKVLDY
jgi:hypothetical protein